jgi:hypothetical protein
MGDWEHFAHGTDLELLLYDWPNSLVFHMATRRPLVRAVHPRRLSAVRNR